MHIYKLSMGGRCSHIIYCSVNSIIGVSKAPLQDVVPVHANPAYQLVTIQRTDELHINQSSVISSHSTTQQTITTDSAAVSHQYENAVEVNKKYRGDGNEHDYENMHVDS